jgi:hypothetical protein
LVEEEKSLDLLPDAQLETDQKIPRKTFTEEQLVAALKKESNYKSVDGCEV